MNNFEVFNNIIEHIENNLALDLDINMLSKMAGLSVYEFRRIFAFITGVPISEYVRCRRMTSAAEEIINGKMNVTEAGQKYGYQSPSSFSRAFKDFHGISPAEATHSQKELRAFTRFSFDLTVSGGESFSYTLLNMPRFWVNGIYGRSDANDTECCENVWATFEKNVLSKDRNFFGDSVYAVYKNGEDAVDCYIGAISDEKSPCSESIFIPESQWICFKFNTTDDTEVNAFYDCILFKWLPSLGFVRDESIPNIEVFPFDMSKEGFEWEIRIAVKRG